MRGQLSPDVRRQLRGRRRGIGLCGDDPGDDPLPQVLKNVRFKGGKPLEDNAVKDVIAAAEAELDGKGRLVIRPSGTEPVIRVMAEGDDKAQVEAVVDRICDAVRKAAA